MPLDPNTDNPDLDNPSETKPLDTEDWEIALEPFKAHPGAALMLGFNFMVLRSYLDIEPIKVDEAIDAIDRAVAVLFQHTQFHEKALEMFHRLIEGELTLEEEEQLKSLGLRF